MAYDTKELERQSLEAITKYKLIWIEEVVSYLPCSKPTFYEHKLNELNSIKEAVQKNRDDLKVGLRKKWYESDNATTQIALYKLIGTDDESDRINSQKQKVEHSGEIQITGISVKVKRPADGA
jgi:hypothetical protein